MKDRALSVAVVGGGVGGLSAAIRAARAGCKVTLYERNASLGGRANRIEAAGFAFDTGPSLLNYPWVFQELFRTAGANFEDHVTLLPVDPGMRFVWPDGETLTLSSDLPSLADEFERHEPGAGTRLMEWIAHSESRFHLVMRRIACIDSTNVLCFFRRAGILSLLRAGLLGSMHGSLRRFFRSNRILDALGAYAMYLGGSPWDLPAAFSVLPYGEIADGLWLPRGGMYALVQALQRLAASLNVRIYTETDIKQVIPDGRRCRWVVLPDSTAQDFDAVILNADAPAARERLLRDVPGAPRLPAMTPAVLTFYIGLRRPPGGLGHHTVFMPQDARTAFRDLMAGCRVPPDLPFYVAVPSLTDPTLAPDGQATLFILVPLPLPAKCPASGADDLVGFGRGYVMRRLKRHGIEIGESDILFETAWTPRDWESRFCLHQASAFGAAHMLRQIGPWRWPNRDPYIRGLYYVGASTVPGTGLPTVTISGRLTVERMLHDAR